MDEALPLGTPRETPDHPGSCHADPVRDERFENDT